MFFNKLKGKMRELGYTQKKLATELKITAQTLNAKLNGRSDFTLKEILKLKNILGLEVLNDFFLISNPKNATKNLKKSEGDYID